MVSLVDYATSDEEEQEDVAGSSSQHGNSIRAETIAKILNYPTSKVNHGNKGHAMDFLTSCPLSEVKDAGGEHSMDFLTKCPLSEVKDAGGEHSMDFLTKCPLSKVKDAGEEHAMDFLTKYPTSKVKDAGGEHAMDFLTKYPTSKVKDAGGEHAMDFLTKYPPSKVKDAGGEHAMDFLTKYPTSQVNHGNKGHAMDFLTKCPPSKVKDAGGEHAMDFLTKCPPSKVKDAGGEHAMDFLTKYPTSQVNHGNKGHAMDFLTKYPTSQVNHGNKGHAMDFLTNYPTSQVNHGNKGHAMDFLTNYPLSEVKDDNEEQAKNSFITNYPLSKVKDDDEEHAENWFHDQADDVAEEADNPDIEERPGIGAGEALPLLAELPPSTQSTRVPTQQEKELEDLVKPKDWELKLAQKAERKRKHHHHHHRHSTKEEKKNSSKKIKTSEDSAVAKTSAKKETVIIPAFGGLKGLASDVNEEESDEPLNHTAVASSSDNLLSMLPKPKNGSKTSRSANIFLPSSLHSAKSTVTSKVPIAKEMPKHSKPDEEGDDDSDEDFDSSDFFGLKRTADLPRDPDVTLLSNVSRGIRPEQEERRDDIAGPSASAPIPESSVESEAAASASSLGFIDDNQALHMIYARDVAHLGGTVSNAAQALENMVDVNVDQVLGPNVQATLLKNLHNKSIAEATLSHLANVPKSKDVIDMVARRKHQITYLASMAVAREEQLAEQWSQNRHNKRVASRKYGF